MVRINFNVDDLTYFQLKQRVGEGNISSTFRSFALSVINRVPQDEEKLKKELAYLEKEEEEIKNRKLVVQVGLKEIEEKKEKLRKKMQDIEANTIRTFLSEVC